MTLEMECSRSGWSDTLFLHILCMKCTLEKGLSEVVIRLSHICNFFSKFTGVPEKSFLYILVVLCKNFMAIG